MSLYDRIINYIIFSFIPGSLLLYIACIMQHKEIVEFLVSKGVDVNTGLSKKSFYANLERPLSVACRVNNMTIIEFLMTNKAEITESIANQYPELTGKLLEKYDCFKDFLKS